MPVLYENEILKEKIRCDKIHLIYIVGECDTLRMRKKPNLAKRLEKCGVVMPASPEQLRGGWKEKFGYDKVYLEIGCGKGRFITETAKSLPDALFIGVEREQGALVMAMEKAINQEIKNICFLDIDAACLNEIFEKGEIDGIYLNFSDPWPRKKQAKRRLTHRGFLEKYDEALSSDGFIFFKTDNSKLFEFSLNEMAEYGLKLRNITFDLAASGMDNVVTEYESRFMEQGMNIYRVEAYK